MKIQFLIRKLQWLLAVCFVFTQGLHAQERLKIYADPETMPGIKASKFIDHIDFIPLELTETSNYEAMKQGKIAGDQVIVFNGNSLYFFDKHTGKFLHRYENAKKRFKISSFQYAPDKHAVLVISKNKHYSIGQKKAQQLLHRWQGEDISKIICFEWIYLDKNYLTERVPTPSQAISGEYTYFNGGFIFKNQKTDSYSKDSTLYLIVQYDAQGRKKSAYFPFLNIAHLWSDFYWYTLPIFNEATTSDSSMLMQVDLDPTIYEIRPDTLIEKYRFVFPSKYVATGDYASLKFRNEIDFNKYLDKISTAFTDSYLMMEHDSVLIFGMRSRNYQQRTFLLLNKILYDYDKVITDSSIHQLSPAILKPLIGQDKQYIYALVSPSLILPKKQLLLKDPKVSARFKQYLSELDPEAATLDILVSIQLK